MTRVGTNKLQVFQFIENSPFLVWDGGAKAQWGGSLLIISQFCEKTGIL